MVYHGLILDFGGVVTTDFYGALSAFCERQGLPPDAALRALRYTREGREALAAVETGHLAQADYETILANLLGVSPDGLLGRALADLRPRQEILALIHDARDAGIHVGILSNSWGTGTYDPYDGYGLDRLVNAVVISDQVGLRKPDPSIYQLTAAKMGIPPEDCVFVDDTKANLPAASKLGMKGVHFTDAQSGVAEIRHLLDLADGSASAAVNGDLGQRAAPPSVRPKVHRRHGHWLIRALDASQADGGLGAHVAAGAGEPGHDQLTEPRAEP